MTKTNNQCVTATWSPTFKKRGDTHPQLMGRYIRNNVGEIEVDPTCQKDQYLRWRYSLETEQGINYRTLRKVSPKSSELITRYVLDMADGKNIAKGTRRGPRAYNNLNAIRLRLERTVEILEKEAKKDLIYLTEDGCLAYIQWNA